VLSTGAQLSTRQYQPTTQRIREDNRNCNQFLWNIASQMQNKSTQYLKNVPTLSCTGIQMKSRVTNLMPCPNYFAYKYFHTFLTLPYLLKFYLYVDVMWSYKTLLASMVHLKQGWKTNNKLEKTCPKSILKIQTVQISKNTNSYSEWTKIMTSDCHSLTILQMQINMRCDFLIYLPDDKNGNQNSPRECEEMSTPWPGM
jgi:hypothetical protein